MAAEQKIVFTGNPRAVEGSNVITGTKMIYLIAEDRSIVENSKVFLEQEPGAGKAE
jgi:lipopolysaccharide export system protein LptA